MTNATSDIEYRQSQAVDMDEAQRTPHGKLTKQKARARIAKVVPFNRSANAAFDKREVNQIHRFPTGEFYTRPARVHSDDAPRSFEIKDSVARHAHVITFLNRAEWYEETGRRGKLDTMQFSARGLRRLCAVCEELSHGNRDWKDTLSREEAVKKGAVPGGNRYNEHGDESVRLYRAALRADTKYDFGANNMNEKFAYERGSGGEDGG